MDFATVRCLSLQNYIQSLVKDNRAILSSHVDCVAEITQIAYNNDIVVVLNHYGQMAATLVLLQGLTSDDTVFVDEDCGHVLNSSTLFLRLLKHTLMHLKTYNVFR